MLRSIHSLPSSPLSSSLSSLRFEALSDATDPARVMERPSDAAPDGSSPRTFAINHVRPKSSFQGCSRISDYELQGKLGEGTFGYDWPFVPHLDSNVPNSEANANDCTVVRFTALDHAKQAHLSP